MSAIRGTIRGGQVVLDEPADLPDGTPVVVRETTEGEYVGVGMREEDWPTDEAGVAALVASIDQIQPWMTADELAAREKTRAEDKAFQLSQWEKWCRELEDLFDDSGAVVPDAVRVEEPK